MKKLSILSALAFLVVINSQAQEKTFQKYYFQAGGGGSSNNGGFAELSLHAVLKKNWMIGVLYQTMTMDPKNLPSDYEPGYTTFFIIPIPDAMPSVDMNVVSFTAGKCLPVARKVWFAAEAGMSIVSGEKMSFNRQAVDNSYGIFDYTPSNYPSTIEKKTTIGGMLRADFNWAICRYIGIGLGAHANLNSIQSTTGVEFKLIVGNLANKKK
jgi:hypothetical protein